MSIRVLVADDAILFRRVLTEVLASLPGVEVVGTAANGRLAIRKVRELHPDILTLDIEMPEMDGLAVLDELRRGDDAVQVIVVSALSRTAGDLTVRALEKGAFDFITKSETSGPQQSREALARDLAPRIRAIANRLEIRGIIRGKSSASRSEVAAAKVVERVAAPSDLDGVAGRMQRLTATTRPGMVLVGVSTGGPAALTRILPGIPGDLGVPIFIVQHMPPVFTQSLAESLAAKCAMSVREAVHGELAEPNTVYIAPGGRHMRLGTEPGDRVSIQITDDPPENNCRPAVDYLFRSAANHFPGRAMAVILTGMGSDGTVGLRLLKRRGCFVIAQDEASCVVYGMPKAAIEAGVADIVLPLDAIAGRIASTVRGGSA
jgi:two-component system chemotaxis response regulator CheB